MVLQKLSLINFRNLKNQEVNFSDRLNILFGNNAQGKTNLLEAIYLISTGKSFRTRVDHELISWGQGESRLLAKAGFLDIEVKIRPDEKALLINKQKSKATELIGSFIAIVFTPADIEIVSGAPERRRKFIDQLASLLDKNYLYTLIQFNKVLRNRNQILWQLKNGKQADLSIWNRYLVKNAVSLWESRYRLVEKLNQELKILGEKVTGNSLAIVYEPALPIDKTKTLRKNYAERLARLEREEINKGITLLGPQRDDFSLVSEEIREEKITSKKLGVYGSRGEQRAATLALKLSEVSLIKKEKNDTPVLLLDEVLSELDREHREFLLRQIRGLQTFITTTSLENLKQEKIPLGAKFEITDGLITAR